MKAPMTRAIEIMSDGKLIDAESHFVVCCEVEICLWYNGGEGSTGTCSVCGAVYQTSPNAFWLRRIKPACRSG